MNTELIHIQIKPNTNEHQQQINGNYGGFRITMDKINRKSIKWNGLGFVF